MGNKKYKAVDNKILPAYLNKPRVIIYDDENIKYYVGNGASFDWEPQYMTYESVDGTKTPLDMGVDVHMHLDETKALDNIKLDDTTMRRIAEFNKSQECKRLDEKIKEKKARIKEIETILEDREHRLVKLKEYIRHIYEIDVNDDDWDD